MTPLEQPVEEILTQKVYKLQAIRVATFLGGPLVAGYLMAENFKVFDERKKLIKTWIFTVIATVLIFALAFSMPDSSTPGSKIILPLIYSWIAYLLAQKYQGAEIKEHLNNEGLLYSWWRVIAISLIGVVITLIPIVIFFFIFG